MLNRKLVLSACCIGLLMLAASSHIGAGSNVNKTMRITFSQPVRLPGVALAAGTYLFEVPDPTSAWDVVQVLNKDHSKVYFMGFTQIVERPAGLSRGQVVSLGESAQGAPTPIKVWYPDNESTGRQFIYPESR